jgi:hypothetical protein
MAATLYLAGSIFILAVAASSWFQARRIGPLVPGYFFTGLARGRARAPGDRGRRGRDAWLSPRSARSPSRAA